MTAARRWWLVYGACAALALAVLAGISALVLRLEASERHAQADAEHQESLRLAMWRMDSWLAPYLAREASRPHTDFSPFVPQPLAVKRDASGVADEEVLVPSPLLAFRSELFDVHFQLDEAGGLTSPQLPAGPLRALAAAQLVESELETRRRGALEGLRPALRRDEALARLARAERIESKSDGAPAGAARLESLIDAPPALAQQLKNQAEFEARLSCAVDTNAPPRAVTGAASAPTTVGPLVPLWLDAEGGVRAPLLVLVRRVGSRGADLLQGVVVNWPALSGRLVDQVRDLYPEARLEPIRGGDPADAALGRDMAMLPVRLVTGSPAAAAVPLLTPARATLGLGWLAMLAALATVGLTLRHSVEFAERRDRFVSAVTHEMRTPLTTFRMYAGMLADGMVEGEDERRSYLETLRGEAARLSSMVENVLAYARLERGRAHAGRREDISVSELISALSPDLIRRAAEAERTLTITAGAGCERRAHADVDAIGQILGNLVDNACKYGGGADDPSIDVEASAENGVLRFAVRDRGPGVPPEVASSIFAPFDRGARPAADGTPGLGLGLAISRGLARDLGGELTLETSGERGATFVLEVPL